ncbi:Entericidin EcnAB [Alkalicaulis satelles]|uniref:Entericidin EcnAB n=1 Tax=Alkalicaulis satelles TaxID=2609175 RepID=A0A5M6ZMW0_9PROT|nr:Entericidin EcnAB [Alkalicaulis satelles]KAA5805027.1 Entericidin EcnAB [Alkalicaulis satelles]
MKPLATALLLAAALALPACNTIQGVGQDITRTGEVLEDLFTEADVQGDEAVSLYIG